MRWLIPLGYLAPRIIEAVAEGRQPVRLTVEALTQPIALPFLWSAQEQALDQRRYAGPSRSLFTPGNDADVHGAIPLASSDESEE